MHHRITYESLHENIFVEGERICERSFVPQFLPMAEERVWSGGARADGGGGDGNRESDEEFADNFLAGARAELERMKKARMEAKMAGRSAERSGAIALRNSFIEWNKIYDRLGLGFTKPSLCLAVIMERFAV